MDEPAPNVLNLPWYTATFTLARQQNIGVLLEGTAGNATISFENGATLTHLFRTGHWLKLFLTANNLRNNGAMSFKASLWHALNGLLPSAAMQRLKPGSAPVNLDYTTIQPSLATQYKLLPKVAARLRDNPPNIHTYRRNLFEWFDNGTVNAAVRAMAGLDLRDPTADKRIWDFTYSIPVEQHIAGRHFRSLIRRAMRHRLPPSTLARYKRGMQAADWYHTIAENPPTLRAELPRIQQSPSARHFLDLTRLQTLLDTFPTQGYETPEVRNQWNYALARGIAVGHFLHSHDPALIPLE